MENNVTEENDGGAPDSKKAWREANGILTVRLYTLHTHTHSQTELETSIHWPIVLKFGSSH